LRVTSATAAGPRTMTVSQGCERRGGGAGPLPACLSGSSLEKDAQKQQQEPKVRLNMAQQTRATIDEKEIHQDTPRRPHASDRAAEHADDDGTCVTSAAQRTSSAPPRVRSHSPTWGPAVPQRWDFDRAVIGATWLNGAALEGSYAWSPVPSTASTPIRMDGGQLQVTAPTTSQTQSQPQPVTQLSPSPPAPAQPTPAPSQSRSGGAVSSKPTARSQDLSSACAWTPRGKASPMHRLASVPLRSPPQGSSTSADTLSESAPVEPSVEVRYRRAAQLLQSVLVSPPRQGSPTGIAPNVPPNHRSAGTLSLSSSGGPTMQRPADGEPSVANLAHGLSPFPRCMPASQQPSSEPVASSAMVLSPTPPVPPSFLASTSELMASAPASARTPPAHVSLGSRSQPMLSCSAEASAILRKHQPLRAAGHQRSEPCSASARAITVGISETQGGRARGQQHRQRMPHSPLRSPRRSLNGGGAPRAATTANTPQPPGAPLPLQALQVHSSHQAVTCSKATAGVMPFSSRTTGSTAAVATAAALANMAAGPGSSKAPVRAGSAPGSSAAVAVSSGGACGRPVSSARGVGTTSVSSPTPPAGIGSLVAGAMTPSPPPGPLPTRFGHGLHPPHTAWSAVASVTASASLTASSAASVALSAVGSVIGPVGASIATASSVTAPPAAGVSCANVVPAGSSVPGIPPSGKSSPALTTGSSSAQPSSTGFCTFPQRDVGALRQLPSPSPEEQGSATFAALRRRLPKPTAAGRRNSWKRGSVRTPCGARAVVRTDSDDGALTSECITIQQKLGKLRNKTTIAL